MFYFSHYAPSSVGDIIVKDKQKYFDLYGEQDVEVLLFFITSTKFNEAISEDNQEKYDQAVEFTKQALSQGWLDDILPAREIDRLKAQNKWSDVFKLYEERKNKGDIDEGEINYFCWDVYKNCDDQQVIANCIEWMKEVTNQEAAFAYLETYAFLMHKSGDKAETGRIVDLAMKAAIKENEQTKSLEKLLKQL